MKAFKMMGFGTRKSKKGFTLIELLIVMVILAILAGVIVMAVSGVFKSAGDTAYNTTKEQLADAVALYAANSSHPGQYPTTGGTNTTTNCSACSVINVSKLLVSEGGLLQKLPDGLYAASGTIANMSNCGYAGMTVKCVDTNHYQWLIQTTNGSIYSLCIGGCTLNTLTGTDGFGGLWP
jgi:prepilin-type N-terminal cleavage/methylation domain-containing protein